VKADVKNFLADLKQVGEANAVSIKIPSTKKKATFKQFNVTQQKKLLRSAFDGVEGSIETGSIFNGIVKDNCEEDINFLLCDRSTVLLELRKGSIGNKFTIEDNSYDLSTLKPFDIKEVDLTKKIEVNGVEVSAKIPTLDVDTKINNKLIAEFGKLTDNQKQVQSVELVLIYEIVKYIDSIKIGDVVINFEDISVYERVSIVNELPLALNNNIIDYISGTKTVETESLTFDDGNVVEIDAGFLAAD
tara:strand:- start:19217 stop:19954 length:738 start_codon:yes stop_codon:yes gene_type:complete